MVDATMLTPGRFRLLRKSYLPRLPGGISEVIDAGEEITFDGIPGPHMEPLDEAAAANVEKSGLSRDLSTLDPVELLPVTIGPR